MRRKEKKCKEGRKERGKTPERVAETENTPREMRNWIQAHGFRPGAEKRFLQVPSGLPC